MSDKGVISVTAVMVIIFKMLFWKLLDISYVQNYSSTYKKHIEGDI